MSSMVSGKIQTKIFTVENTYSNCQQIVNDIKTSCGTNRFIAVSQRDIDTFAYNGIYLICIMPNKAQVSDALGAIRFRNGWYRIEPSASYDASVPIGDKYTVYILDSIDA